MHKQRLGRLTVTKILEMEDGVPLPFIFPDITEKELARLALWHDDPDLGPTPADSAIVLSMHSFVLTLDGKTILIDTCNGNCKQRSLPSIHMLDTPYLERMAEAGVTPEDVDLVLCTHLHFDHVGWNTRYVDGRWVPTFSNARYVFGRRDYDHWISQNEGSPHQEAFADSVLPVIEAGMADLVDVTGPTPVFQGVGDGVWLEPAFGHSPGNCTVHAQAGGSEAIFWGDVIHHPIQLIRPDLALAFDDDQAAAITVRQKLLARVADSDILCFPAHFRHSSIGQVRRDRDAYRFEFIEI